MMFSGTILVITWCLMPQFGDFFVCNKQLVTSDIDTDIPARCMPATGEESRPLPH